MFLGEAPAAESSQQEDPVEKALAKDDKKLSTMDKVVITSVVVSAIGVLVQLWSITNQAARERERSQAQPQRARARGRR